MRRVLLLSLTLLSAAACLTGPLLPDGGDLPMDAGAGGGGGGGDAGAPDAGDDGGAGEDAGLELDSGVDAGFDAGHDAGVDAGPRGALDGGHAQVVGECFRVAPELGTASPSYLEVRLDFGMDQFDDPAERARLTAGAQTILATPNAGGSSVVSEAFAFEVLALCEGAELVKTETEIVYAPPTSKKTDLLVAIDGQHLGVSVTRAVSFPADAGYPLTQARLDFLEGKLDDILVSSMNVQPPDGWVKQALVVMAYGDEHAATIRAAWAAIDAASKADTIVYVVVTDGPDTPIYF